MGKMSLRRIAAGYLSTLVDARTEKKCLSDIVIQICIPIVSGAVFFAFWPASKDSMEGLADGFVTGVSIVSALLCGVAVMVFQLRIQIASQTDPRPTGDESILIDEMFNAVLWAVVVGFGAVLLLILRNAFQAESTAWKVLISISLSLLMNFVMVSCLCLKRLSAAYAIVSKCWTPRR